MTDSIQLIVQMAFKQYEQGNITKAQLVEILQDAINVRAIQNGYADKYGMPFPFPESEL